MHVFHAQANLSKPVEDLVFIEVPTPLLLNQLLQISTICKVHHYAKMTFFCFVNFAECYYVWVIQNFKNLCFLESLLSFPFCHLLYIDLLDHAHFFVRLGLDKECLPKGPLSKELDLLVNFKLVWVSALLFIHAD
jgi:hypothetical protein